MKNTLFAILTSVILLSCSDNDVPKENIQKENDTIKSIASDSIDSFSIDNVATEKSANAPEASKRNNVSVIKYDDSKEKVAEHNIFTDGNFYVFQVSAWKSKRTADNQAAILKKEGYDSFVTTKKFENGQVWYRVRVGYFNSLAEAKKAEAKM